MINDTVINGNATQFADSITGGIEATALFNSFDNKFHPAVSGLSLLSVCCANGARAVENAKNIITLANRTYTSIRDIEMFAEDGSLIGSISINGRFSKIREDVAVGDVTVNGKYSGPMDIEFPDGYEIILIPEGKINLMGEFRKTYVDRSGIKINTINKQRYIFNDGVTSILENVISTLIYSEQSSWDKERKILRLIGQSEIRSRLGM